MEGFSWNYLHCAAWLIFNHYSVWLSSLSGLSTFLRTCSNALRTTVVTGISDRTKSNSALVLLVSHISRAFCRCQSSGQRASRHSAPLDPPLLSQFQPDFPPTLHLSPSPNTHTKIHTHTHARTLYHTQQAFVLLCSCVARRSCAFCASCVSRSWELQYVSHMFRVIGNILYQMLMQIKGHMAGVVSYLPVELSQNMNWHLKIACFVSLTVQTIFEF